MGRSPCCEKVGLKKGPWTPEEDQKLMAFIEEHGHGSWRALPAKAGLQRCGKSCRLRWTNYLRPDIKRGKFSLEEEQTIIRLHALLGNKWSTIAAHLPQRTDNEIKNCWNTHLKKRLTKMGIDPITHKPKTDAAGTGTGTGSGHSRDTSNLSHMAQWESARLEAEARLVRETRLVVQNQLGSPSSNSKPARLILNKISPQPSLSPHLDILKASQRSWCNTQSNKDHTRMYDTYAMMLTTDDLESPTSTLCFPESMPLPISTTAGTLNNNFLPSTTTAPAAVDINVAKSSASYKANGNGANLGSRCPAVKKHTVADIVQCELKDGSYSSHHVMSTTTKNMKFFYCRNSRSATGDNGSWKYLPKEAELIEKGVHDRVMDMQDDNIMVAVEAFRAAAGGGYTSNDVVEACLNEDLLCDPNEGLAAEEDNLEIINGDGSNSCAVNFEDNNKHYWNSLLNMVNDLPSGSPAF
ncbi:hypothetical protein L6164_027072 [Bauhinia variegata]|uniref:Uncharacterized protein n=1 Tax=Bauhinia variegata TaxID=167791 RepID=A0ACB9LSC9_BAUVA|nr:hypothetical protein L6164_027072 [Bauhinia variegata]